MKLRHVGITVVDAKESLEFYHGLLGFKIQKDMEESGDYIDNFSGEEGIRVRTIKMSGSDGSLIELLEYHSHPSSKPIRRSITEVGCSHFALTVDDLDNLYYRMKENGVEFNSTPQQSPDGYAKVAFCRDPNGVLIELVEVL